MILWQPEQGASFLPSGASASEGVTAKLRPHATLQLVVLVAIAARYFETAKRYVWHVIWYLACCSDVVFAMDSIPAILSITTGNVSVFRGICCDEFSCHN
jgi:hypothetical protein